MKPNAELAYLTLDQIDAHPELHSQSWWFTVTDCGTVACFAGWTCVISGDKPSALDRPMHVLEIGTDVSFVVLPDGEKVYASDRARELLGIDKLTARRLFDGSNTREDLGRLVAEIFGPRPESYGSGCRCDYLGAGTPEHTPGAFCPKPGEERTEGGAS